MLTGVLVTAGTTQDKYKTGTATTGSQNVNFNTGNLNTSYTAVGFVTSPCGTQFSTPVSANSGQCLAAGTLVTLSDGGSKAIEDITCEDSILVWDFDLGRFAASRALWIKRAETAGQFNLVTFSDGTTLSTVADHRIFNKEAGRFTHPMSDDTPIGTTTFNQHGEEITLVSKEVVVAEVDHYNVITDRHVNLFANSVLTSCRFNNIYPVAAMKFVKDDRKLRSTEEFAAIPDRFITGLRLSEQTMDLAQIEWYVRRLLKTEARGPRVVRAQATARAV